jgi:hypothetical protein
MQTNQSRSLKSAGFHCVPTNGTQPHQDFGLADGTIPILQRPTGLNKGPEKATQPYTAVTMVAWTQLFEKPITLRRYKQQEALPPVHGKRPCHLCMCCAIQEICNPMQLAALNKSHVESVVAPELATR